MSALPHPIFTEAEYLALEAVSETKHEFYRGEIIMMAGVSPRHDTIVVNTLASLHAQLRGGNCRAYTSDIRVKAAKRTSYFYPDIKVVCGEPQFNHDNPPCLLNPTLVIEVLSPSTKNFDLGAKADDFRTLDSLQELVLIVQDKARIQRYRRNPDNSWTLEEVSGTAASMTLPSISCTLALADVYAGVEFEDEA